jgi:hypothetical protein
LIIVDGDPGLGKSTMLLDIAARVSAGRPMPFEAVGGVARDVVLISCEDGLADTVQPRLQHAGADTTRIHHGDLVKTAGDPRPLSLPQDVDELAKLVTETSAALVIIDPFVGPKKGGPFRGSSTISVGSAVMGSCVHSSTSRRHLNTWTRSAPAPSFGCGRFAIKVAFDKPREASHPFAGHGVYRIGYADASLDTTANQHRRG